MERILDAADLSFVRQLILGPNNDHAAVRGWLENHGWQMVDERFVHDRGHEYQLMSAVPGKMSLSSAERAYGPILLKTRNEGLIRHLRGKIAALSEACSLSRDPDKRQELESRIRNLEELIR
jgi:tRNA (adenine22-N1)-methyltransferase